MLQKDNNPYTGLLGLMRKHGNEGNPTVYAIGQVVSVSPLRVKVGGIELDDKKKEVRVDGETVSLTPKEFEILKFLMSSPNRVFSPKEIYSSIWKERPYGAENTIAVHIRHIREKIEINPAEPRYIKVVFGQGYMIQEDKRR